MDKVFENVNTFSIEKVGGSYVIFVETKNEEDEVKTFENESIMINILINDKCIMGLDNPDTLEPYFRDDYEISKVVISQENETLYMEMYLLV